jgi:hypothetical protein
VIVTHDRRFLTPDDIVLEIEDGRLKNGELATAEPDGHSTAEGR